tara:strand:+ start:520 stop:705 length:186 start_codon:yes stop_codon:yes gene_type:complete
MTQLISFKQLRVKLGGRSRSACYLDLEAGRLPKPIKIGRILYWDEGRLNEHLASLQKMDDG